MDDKSKYEHFIAHLVPGVVSLIGITAMFDLWFCDGAVSLFLNKLNSWKEGPLVIAVATPMALFLGLWLDGVKHWTVERIFKRILNRSDDYDTLSHLNALGPEKYRVILNEYYPYYQYCINSAFALILVGTPLPYYLLNRQLLSEAKCFWLYVTFFALVAISFASGFDYYRRFHNSFNSIKNAEPVPTPHTGRSPEGKY